MRIVVPGFTGLNKRIAPEKIQETEATAALDCNFRTGDLQGYFADADSGISTGPASTIFDYTPSQELVSSSVMDVVKSPVLNDSYGRIYFANTAGGKARVIQSTNVSGSVTTLSDSIGYALGVPSPAPLATYPSYQIHQGTVTSLSIKVRPSGNTSDQYDTVVTVASSLPTSIHTGSQVAMSCAGVDSNTFTIKFSSSAPNQMVLEKTGMNQHKISDFGSTNGLGKLDSGGVTSGHFFAFKASSQSSMTNENLQVGDQVLISFANSSSDTTMGSGSGKQFSSSQVYTVSQITGLIVQLDDANGSGLTVSTTLTNAKVNSHGTFYWMKVVSSSNAMDPAGVSVTNDGSGRPTAISYTVQADDQDTWEDAADSSLLQAVSYIVTYVNKFGEESQPSQPTDTFNIIPGSPVKFLQGFIASTGGYMNSSDMTNYPTSAYAPLVGIRLYRTDLLGSFRLVADEKTLTTAVVLGSGSDGVVYTDSKTDAQLAESVPTVGWAAPPTSLSGLLSAPGGVVFGYYGNTICPSVAYAPYAFPVAYQLATDSPIVGQVVTSAGIAVLTQARPYLVTGTDPSLLSAIRLEVPYSCSSHQSIVDLGSCAMYASPDGLVLVQGADIKVVTEDMMTRQQWQNYNPSTIVAGHSESKYIGSYVPLSGGSRKGFIFDVLTGSFSDITLSATAFYNDLTTDTLKYVNASGSMMQWNRSSSIKSFTWISKVFQTPYPATFACAQVVAYNFTGSTLTLQLYDALTNTQIGNTITITGSNPFRLPSGTRYQALQVVLNGTGPIAVSQVVVASSMDELKEV